MTDSFLPCAIIEIILDIFASKSFDVRRLLVHLCEGKNNDTLMINPVSLWGTYLRYIIYVFLKYLIIKALVETDSITK
jgi:hypothetical protein